MLDNSRFVDMLPSASWDNNHVSILGCGGGGSHLAHLLARMGAHHMTLWDDDNVAEENLAVQMFTRETLGENKAFALCHLINDTLVGEEIACAYAERATPDDVMEWLTSIVCCEVDSMDTRAALFAAWWDVVKDRAHDEIYGGYLWIESRTGGEVARVYAVQSHDGAMTEQYRKTLYTSAEAASVPCGARSVGYMQYLAGGLEGLAVQRFLRDDYVPFEQIIAPAEVGIGLFTSAIKSQSPEVITYPTDAMREAITFYTENATVVHMQYSAEGD